MERKEIYHIIDGERDYQDARWMGSENTEHEIASFILYMEYNLSEARKWVCTVTPEIDALEHLRKVVALGIKCFEVHGCPERK